jgi:hypothetical protein
MNHHHHPPRYLLTILSIHSFFLSNSITFYCFKFESKVHPFPLCHYKSYFFITKEFYLLYIEFELLKHFKTLIFNSIFSILLAFKLATIYLVIFITFENFIMYLIQINVSIRKWLETYFMKYHIATLLFMIFSENILKHLCYRTYSIPISRFFICRLLTFLDDFMDA